MTQPTARQSHIDAVLTNLSIGYSNAAFIADQIFPAVRVAKQSDKFFTFTKADWFRDEASVRAPGTRAALVGYNISTDSYLCVEKAMAKNVTDEEVKNADAPLDPYRTATNYVTEKLLLAKEIEVLGNVFGSGWSASATPSTLWDVNTSDPLNDIETGVNTIELAIGRPVNISVIGRSLWRHVKNHPDIVDRLKGAADPQNPGLVTLAAFAALAEINGKVLISRALYNTADEGLTAAYAYIAGLHMFIGFVTPGPALATPSAGYIFSWKGREVNRYRDDIAHTDVVECLESWDTKVTAADAGYLVKSAASS